MPTTPDSKIPEFFSTREILEQIARIKEQFYISDRLPYRINAETPNFHNYKSRTTYFTTINGLLDFINWESDPEMGLMCKQFRQFVRETIGHVGEEPSNWITKEHVQYADEFLAFLENYFKMQI